MSDPRTLDGILVSVIVPAYNAARTLPVCLAKLENQTVSWSSYEVIVVDDGSTDATREIAQGYGVRLLTQPNHGPAAARNLGVQAAQGEILLFTDADCAPAPDWIAAMIEPLADPDVVGVKGAYRTRQREMVARFVQAEYEDKYDKMHQERYIDFVDTYAAAYRRCVFADGQGFDPAFPRASGEDVEFSYRLAQRGYKMVFAPGAVVYHQHVASALGYLRRKYYVGYWRVRMYRKHPQKALADSHTPQMLKAQVGLALLMVAFLPASVLWRGFLAGAAMLAVLFGLSTIPFCLKTLKKERAVALVSPALLLLRALALGTGFGMGILDHLLGRRGAE